MDELDPCTDALGGLDGIATWIASARPHTVAFDAMDAADGWARPLAGGSWALEGLLLPPAELPPGSLPHERSSRRAAELMQ